MSRVTHHVSCVTCQSIQRSRVQEEQPGGQEVAGHAADAGESAAAAGPLPGERQQGAEGADGGEGPGVGQAEVILLFILCNIISSMPSFQRKTETV